MTKNLSARIRHQLVLLAMGLCLAGAAHAAGPLDAWRSEAAATRILAENDAPHAYEEAKRLQAALPGDATPADQARLLNLLSRIETYLALTDEAARHAQAAMDLAKRHGDAVGQVEADLNVALNAVNQAKIDEVVAATTRSMEMLKGVDRPDLLAEAMLRTSMKYRRLGQFDDSVTIAIQTMDIARHTGDRFALTYACQGLAIAYDQSGRKQEAHRYFLEMRDHARAAGSRLLEADAMVGLGQMAGGDAGEELIRAAIALYRSAGAPFSVAHGLYAFADGLRQQGHHAAALPLLDEVAAIYEHFSNKIGLWWALGARSESRQALGQLAAAQADAERAYALAREIGLILYLGESEKHLAALAAARGDHPLAYQLTVKAAERLSEATAKRSRARMVELAKRYQAESRQREIDELTRRNERQAAELQHRALQQRWLWTVLAASLILLAGTAYFLLRLRRSNRLLEALNTQVRRSQNKLQAALDAIPDSLFVLGLDGRNHEYHSPRTDLLPAPAEALLGKTVSDFLPAEAADAWMSALREAHENGVSSGAQFELQLPHGKFRFELSVARKTAGQGEEPLFIVLSRDITERKQAEREIALLNRAVNASSESAFLMNEQGRFVYVNDASCHSLGYSREELLTMTASDIDPYFTPEEHKKMLGEMFEFGPIYGLLESQQRMRDGRIFPVELNGTLIEYEGEKFALLTARDITERKLSEHALRESEEKYRTLIQKIQVAVVVHGADTRILTANPAAQEILGLPEDLLLGKTALDSVWHFFQEDGRTASHDEYPVNRVLASREPLRNYVFGVHRPGKEEDAWVLVNADPVFDEHGELAEVIVSFIDITQRKHAEEVLAVREREFRTLAENIPDHIIRYDGSGRKVYLNSATARLMGIDPGALLGQTPEETPENARAMKIDEFAQRLRLVLATGEPQEMEVTLRHAEKGTQIHNVRFVAERDEEGRIVGALMVGRDITERKRMEEGILNREAELRSVTDSSPYSILRYDIDGRMTYANAPLLGYFGLPLAELVGKLPREVWPDERFAEIDRGLASVRETEQSVVVEFSETTAGGEVLYHQVTIVPERGASGEMAGIIAFGLNITERKQAEDLLVQREREFRTLAENMPDTLIRYDREGRRTYINPALKRISAVREEQMIGLTQQESNPFIMPEIYRLALEHTLATGERSELELQIPTPSGDIRTNLVSIAAERAADGQIFGAITIGHDITERKQKEALVHSLNRKLHAISKCNHMLIHTENEQELLNGVCKLVCDEAGYLMAWVGLAENDEHKTVRPVAYSGYENGYLDGIQITWADTERGQVPIGFAIRTGVAAINHDFKTYQALTPWRKEALRRGFRSSVAIPLICNGQILGSLNIYSAEPQAFENEEVELLQELANDIAYGVLALRMRAEKDRVKAELLVREREFRTLAENSPSLIVRYDLNCCRVYVNPAYVRETGIGSDEAFNGAPDAQWAASMDISAREYRAALERVMATGTPAEMFIAWRHPKSGAVNDYAVQMVAEHGPNGSVLGALMLAHNITALKEAERRLEESHVHLRGLAARSEMVREEERKRIARDMHDELGQYLTALRMGVSVLRMQSGGNAPAIQEQARSLSALVDKTIQVTRDIAASLRPAPLDLGVVSALEWLTEEFSRHTHIPCKLDTAEDGIGLDDTHSTAIFRMVQESLTNVARHAEASRVDIRLKRHGDDYLLEVSDNGKGFDPSVPKEKSFGLVGMRERAIMLGAEVAISSAPGHGTTVGVRIPVSTTVREHDKNIDG
ncbi:MAG: PAS domain S-box protein [Thiobacillus sp.]